MPLIQEVTAQEILDSRGNPTVEVEVLLNDGVLGRAATGVTISPAAWEARTPQVKAVPIAVTQALMTNWELLWWMLPMGLVGGLFRRHVMGLVPWEVEKNLARLAGEWAGATAAAAADLRAQAAAWVDAELATLDRLLARRPGEAAALREALRRLKDSGTPRPASA
jgi:hypothetical protein